MIGVETGPDVVVSHVAAVLSQARVATSVLRDVVIPAVPPARRTFLQNLARRIDRRDIFSEEFIRDLDSIIRVLERQIECATFVGWEPDEHHNAGGYEILYRSDDTVAIAAAIPDLEELRDLTSRALDIVRAHAVVEDLLAE